MNVMDREIVELGVVCELRGIDIIGRERCRNELYVVRRFVNGGYFGKEMMECSVCGKNGIGEMRGNRLGMEFERFWVGSKVEWLKLGVWELDFK